MASEEKNYSSEFKAKVALEALSQKKQNLDSLSDKYDVPVSAILTWTVQIEQNAANVFATTEAPELEEAHITEGETIDVEISDSKVTDSISLGVMGDQINLRRLAFWSVLGMVLVVIFVKGLIEMHQYSTQISKERISESSEYYEVNQLKRETDETLSSFGVVNLEEGIYRIPIDSAISEMAVDDNN